jgi:hypothetical protein
MVAAVLRPGLHAAVYPVVDVVAEEVGSDAFEPCPGGLR